MNRVLASIAVLLCSTGALWAQRAGEVSKLLPAGFISRSNHPIEAKLTDAVLWNDVVRTNEQGRMRVALDGGSLLTLGTKSEMRVVKHDVQSQQSAIELLYGRIRSRVVHLTKPGASYNVRTPTAVIGVVGTDFVAETRMGGADVASGGISSLEQLPPGRMPGDGSGPTLADFSPVDATLVYGLAGVTGVKNIDPKITLIVYLLPGEGALVVRGMPPTKFRWDDPKQPNKPQMAALNPYEGCPGLIDLSNPPEGRQVPKYRIAGKGTSTGPAFEVEIENPDPNCPLDVFVPHGAVLKPKGYLKRVIAGILLGGNPPLKDFQVMMTDGAGEELPAAGTPVNGGMQFVSSEGPKTSFILRGFCLELHKLAPHPNTEYKFDSDKTEDLGSNRHIIEASTRLYHQGKTRSRSQSLDSITQWSLWASREKMDEKEFMHEFMDLVEKNYKAQKQKWDKKAKANVESAGKELWGLVTQVLAEAKANPGP